MAKSIKIILISFILLFAFFCTAYATDINMNMTTNQNYVDNTNNTNSTNTINNSSNNINTRKYN